MTPNEALAFVAAHGVVLESARGPVPSLAEAVAGEPIRGSWWAHPKGRAIFRCSRSLREVADILVCRLVDGKLTYVHRRLWPALVRLAAEFNTDQLAAIEELHTVSGRHEVRTIPFPEWVSEDVRRAAQALTKEEAVSLLPTVFHPSRNAPRKRRAGSHD